MALLVLLAATARAPFVAPHLTTLGCVIKPALRRPPRLTISTGAGRSMAFIPVSAFPSYEHVFSQDSEALLKAPRLAPRFRCYRQSKKPYVIT